MSYVLDTNAVSAIMKGEPGTLARLRSVPKREALVPQPVVAEISYGIANKALAGRESLSATTVEAV